MALDDLEMRISEKTGKSINTVRMEVDGTIQGDEKPSVLNVPDTGPIAVSPASREPDGLSPRSREAPDPSLVAGFVEAQQSVPAGEDSDQRDGADEEDSLGIETSRSEENDLPPEPPEGNIGETGELQDSATASPATERFLSAELNTAQEKQPARTDLKSLRSRAYVLATRFGKSLGQHLIHASPNGYGFFVDIPDRPIRDRGEISWWSWWLLFSLSEQAVTKARLGLAPRGLRLPQLLIEDRLDEAFALTGDPPDGIQSLGHVFFSSPELSERAFQDLLSLIETCRTLRQAFPEQKLWSCPTIEQLSGGERR